MNTYLAQVNKSAPDTSKFTIISSNHLPIPKSGYFTFPKPAEAGSTGNIRYFITGITIHQQTDKGGLAPPVLDLAPLPSDIHIKIVCGGQTWISGQLGLLDLAQLKTLIIPLPSPNVAQEIELITTPTKFPPENKQESGALNWLCVAATEFHGEDMPCYRQIIYSVPKTKIIHDSRNTIQGNIPNRISRIVVYIPDNLDVELPLDYLPKIYCDDLTIEPTNGLSRDGDIPSAGTSNLAFGETPSAGTSNLAFGETPSARTHHQVSGPGQWLNSGYKTYCYTLDDLMAPVSPSVIRLDPAVLGTPNHGIKYSIIEKQIVRMKSGYIGLAL